MLRRRYQPNTSRNAKKRKERVAKPYPLSFTSSAHIIPFTSFTLLAILSITALCPVGASSAYAEKATDGSTATFSGWLSSSVTLTMSDSITKSIEPTVTGKFENLATSVRVQVANSDRYTLTIGGNPTMVGRQSSEVINAITLNSTEQANGGKASEDFTSNTWGYNVAAGQDIAKDIYLPLPSATTPTTVSSKTLDNLTADDYYTLNFGAKVDTTLPADTYTSTVTLSVVASPKEVTGFDRTDTMQGMTSSICKEIGSELDIANGTAAKYAATDALGNTYYTKRLTDTRDQKKYWVAKLKDGNCWMTQNLALDIPAEGLTSEKTALAPGKTEWKPVEATRVVANMTEEEKLKRFIVSDSGDWAKMDQQADHSWDEGQYVLIYPGASDGSLGIGFNAAQGGLAGYADRDTILGKAPEATAPVLTEDGIVMDVSGSEWQVATDVDFTSKFSYTQEGKTGTFTKTAGWAVDPVNKVYDSHYLVGNYYQRFAATAQTREEGVVAVTRGQNIEGSICAKNWQLPYSSETWNDESGSFFNLLKAYAGDALKTGGGNGDNADKSEGYSPLTNIISGTTTVETVLTGSPMRFSRTGGATPDGKNIANIGNNGYFWSSTVISGTIAYVIAIKSINIYPSALGHYAYGFSVRCLVLGS